MAIISEELKDSKQFKKVKKLVDEAKAKEILGMETPDLKSFIATHTVNADRLKNETHAKLEYLKAKDIVDTFEKALKDTVDPWKACISLGVEVIKARETV
jgi:hypothetical protein